MAWQYLLSHLATIGTAAGSIVFALHLFGTRRSSQSTLAWLLAFVFVPIVAIPLYLAIGTRKLGKRRKTTHREADDSSPKSPIQHILWGSAIAPATATNSLAVLPDGVTAYERLLALIEAAQKTIHISIFILGNDETGKAIVAALARRSRDGVEVRVIVDAVGSRHIERHAARELRDAGGVLRTFMPLLHLPLRGYSNLRSHRKLAVFDGAHLFTGGMNIALEYMGKTALKSRWRDIAVVASGPVARDAEALFATDWKFCGGTESDLSLPVSSDSITTATTDAAAVSRAHLQLVPSGPDRQDDALYDALLVAIGEARRRLIIVTPYYVPDDPLQRAIEIAARRGVTTELVMPQRSNHALADYARRSRLQDLKDSGVALYAYPHGMIHGKAMIVDDAFAYVGSPNMDMRSLFLNYENALFIYDAESIAKVEAWIDMLKAESERDAFNTKAPFWVLEQIARLLAPEL